MESRRTIRPQRVRSHQNDVSTSLERISSLGLHRRRTLSFLMDPRRHLRDLPVLKTLKLLRHCCGELGTDHQALESTTDALYLPKSIPTQATPSCEYYTSLLTNHSIATKFSNTALSCMSLAAAQRTKTDESDSSQPTTGWWPLHVSRVT